MTNTRKLTEVWEAEYAATRSIESAVAAVATAVLATVPEIPDDVPATTEPRTRIRPSAAPAPKAQPPATLLVLRVAAEHFKLTLGDLTEYHSQRRPHAHARFVAAAILRGRGLTLLECAQAVGLRHPTTVVNALERVKTSPSLTTAVALVTEKLQRRKPAPTTPSREVEAA